MKADLPPFMSAAAFRRNTDDKLVCSGASRDTTNSVEAAELSLLLQGNPLLAPKLHLNGRRFKPIPFWISSPTSLYHSSLPAGPDESCPPSPGARKPHLTTVSPPTQPHSAQSPLCSNL
ncbi:hypothetical protein VZT92_020940 [Zoarces viviparus]|uniref:Uncharacterized protein n=1 Tax=Zoarces viviparus TaxID=48416 RepID=A0AAW1EFZ4_ZOAVI